MSRRACDLAELSFEELEARRKKIVEDPASANPEHAAGRSIYLYTAAARRKLDDLAWAVTYKLQAKRRTA